MRKGKKGNKVRKHGSEHCTQGEEAGAGCRREREPRLREDKSSLGDAKL